MQRQFDDVPPKRTGIATLAVRKIGFVPVYGMALPALNALLFQHDRNRFSADRKPSKSALFAASKDDPWAAAVPTAQALAWTFDVESYATAGERRSDVKVSSNAKCMVQ